MIDKNYEVLTSNHEYGAMIRAWEWFSKNKGYTLTQKHLRIPFTTRDKFLDNLCHQAQKTILMVSHDIAAIQQASHRMIFLEERIRYDGAADCFPGLAELANLREIEPVHKNNFSENTIYQLEDMESK